MKTAKLAALLIACLFAFCACAGCASEKPVEGGQTTVETFAHGKVAVVTGAVQETIAGQTWPNAELLGYASHADAMAAVMAGKADCAVVGQAAFEAFSQDNPQAVALPQQPDPSQIAFAYRKGTKDDALPKEIDAFITKLSQTGELDEIKEYWSNEEQAKSALDIGSLPATNGTVRAVTCANEAPYEYFEGGGFCGIDIDVIYRFCKEKGYGLAMDDLPFASLIAGIGSGKYDVAVCGLIITPERLESIDFSEPVMQNANIIMFNAEVYPASTSEAAEGEQGNPLARSFYKTFVKEDRWKLILGGLGVTLLVTFLSAVFGTVLGFAIAMLRRRGNKAINAALNLYVRLFQGLPVLVVLLIFYYVVFGNADISAVVVAVITFSLNSAAFISEELHAAISSIDPGQRLAALALGFNERQAFLHYVLPPAIRQIVPVYRGEIIGLLKGTSIVGYIALMDLTKAGDIIRSRTYEAVFPLLMIAIVYLLMSWAISNLLKRVEQSLTRTRPLTSIDGVTLRE